MDLTKKEVRYRTSPDECHYFKYGTLDYHSAALNSEDPTSFSLERGKPGIVWNCFQVLPDELRLSERDLLRQAGRSRQYLEHPSQEELRAWIKGKTPDNDQCNALVSHYIITNLPNACIKGLWIDEDYLS